MNRGSGYMLALHVEKEAATSTLVNGGKVSPGRLAQRSRQSGLNVIEILIILFIAAVVLFMIYQFVIKTMFPSVKDAICKVLGC